MLNNHAVALLPTVLQPPKISHHSHQRNKSVHPYPNPVNPPGYGGGQNCINKYSAFEVSCPDPDSKSALDYVTRDVVRHFTRIKRARSSVYSVNHEPV